MNNRYPLIFLTGALVGSFSTYLFVNPKEVQTDQSEIKILSKTEKTFAPQAPAPAAIEVLEVPKYPEQENEELADSTPSDEVPSEEVVPEDPEAVATQVEKFERSIAGEELSPTSEEAPAFEDPKMDEPEPNTEPDQGIE